MAATILGTMYVDLKSNKPPSTGTLKALVFSHAFTTTGTTLAIDFSDYFEEVYHVGVKVVSAAVDADDAPINWAVSAGTVTLTRAASGSSGAIVSGTVWGRPSTA